MSTMFSSLLSWLVSGLLLPLTTILKLVGLLLPPCSSLGIISFQNDVLNNVAQIIRLLWPLLHFVPWSGLWNLFAAILLYAFFRWLWGFLPILTSLGVRFWLIVAVIYVISGALNFFISTDWRDSSVFTEVFGSNPTSTYSGGGMGGGGGGSW